MIPRFISCLILSFPQRQEPKTWILHQLRDDKKRPAAANKNPLNFQFLKIKGVKDSESQKSKGKILF